MKSDYAPTDFDKRCIRWFGDHMKPVWQGTQRVDHSSSWLERKHPGAVPWVSGLLYTGLALLFIYALAYGDWSQQLENFLRTPAWFQLVSVGVILLVAGVLLLGAALWLLALLGFTPATFIIAVLLLLILLRLS